MCSSFIKVVCILSTCVAVGRCARVVAVSRTRSAPTALRPGVSLTRPWMPPPPRLVHRAPYVLYKHPAHQYNQYRYVKHHQVPVGGRVSYASGPWRASPKPSTRAPASPEYEFVRAASAPAPILSDDGAKGAIHTIPAPNLSLSEKPIVVVEATEDGAFNAGVTEAFRPTYEVTEKAKLASSTTRPEVKIFDSPAVGFSKATALTQSELAALVKNGAAVQFGDYGVPAIAIPQTHLIPHYSVQAFNTLLQEPVQTSNEAYLPQNALFKPDHIFIQNMQSQFYPKYPGVEYVQYESATEPQVYVYQKEIPYENTENHKTVVRETDESTVLTLVPRVIEIKNITEKPEPKPEPEPQNVTIELVTSESKVPTTINYVESKEENTTPIYYAQVGQNVGNIIAEGFYSAINDVRAAAALAQVDKPKLDETQENITTTTEIPESKPLMIENNVKMEENGTATEKKALKGVPFTKGEPVNVSYSFLRAENENPKVTKDGTVYAGQLVEASITEDRDFHMENANFVTSRPPLRLLVVQDNTEVTSEMSKLAVVKAKIPPKSKLTFDDKTGEPIIRIYASYMDNPLQKEIITSKLSNVSHKKDIIRKQDTLDNWKAGAVKNLEKSHSGSAVNQVTEFGLKLRPKIDDYITIFDEED